MRVGKNKNIVEAKQTRSCVVKVENMKAMTPLAKGRGRASLKVTPKVQSSQDDKNFKGPLKKRPIAEVNTPIQKDKIRTGAAAKATPTPVKVLVKNVPTTPTVVDTPTIAAGRSRRAIKPNPKYASDDILTPKIVKNVSMLSAAATPASSGPAQKKSITTLASSSNLKQRKLSISSSDDFYNKDSSDDVTEEQDDVYEVDDSDYSEDLEEDKPVPKSDVLRARGRPRKDEQQSPPKPKPATNSAAMTAIKSSPAVKSAPSQLQQLRKTLVAKAPIRLPPSTPLSLKRKRDSISGESESDVSARKRIGGIVQRTTRDQTQTPQQPTQKPKPSIQATVSPQLASKVTRSSLTTKPLEVNKKVVISPIGPKLKKIRVIEIDDDDDEDDVAPVTRPAPKPLPNKQIKVVPKSNSSTPSTSQQSSPQQIKINAAGQAKNNLTKALTRQLRKSPSNIPTLLLPKNIKAMSSNSNTPTSSNNKSPKLTPTTSKSKDNVETATIKEIVKKDVLDVADVSAADLDDFEQMPTFTIVNINDIINKKGDVLTSNSPKSDETPPPPPPPSKTTKPETIATKETVSPSVLKSADVKADKTDSKVERKSSRRKTEHSTILSEKIDPEALKNPRPRSPFPPKKATNTILNYMKASSSKLVATTSTKDDSNTTVASTTPPQRSTRAAVAAAASSKASPENKVIKSAEKPAPRILNAMVAKKTQPVKPMITNFEDSADESMSMEEDDLHFDVDHDGDDDDDEDYDEMKDEDDEDEELEYDRPTRKTKQSPRTLNSYLGSKKNAPATKENSLAATNRQVPSKTSSTPQQRKHTPEKVVISRQGDTIIKKITCFETWFVINPPEEKPPQPTRNQLDMALIKLANSVSDIKVPSDNWTSKISLNELSSATLAKATLPTFTGDLSEHNIAEEDRGKYQPTCVMFRRSVREREKSRMPYDRAVIFKNKTFFTNIDGKNVKLIGAPIAISSQAEVEILLAIVDSLTLQSSLVEQTLTSQ